MSVHVSIVDGPLPSRPRGAPAPGAGAVLVFEGIARPLENGRPISALEYTAYEPMASDQLRALGERTVQAHSLTHLSVEHSRGRVNVGECSFRLEIASPHRGEALRAMAEFIDTMKRDVPIWKAPLYT